MQLPCRLIQHRLVDVGDGEFTRSAPPERHVGDVPWTDLQNLPSFQGYALENAVPRVIDDLSNRPLLGRLIKREARRASPFLPAGIVLAGHRTEFSPRPEEPPGNEVRQSTTYADVSHVARPPRFSGTQRRSSVPIRSRSCSVRSAETGRLISDRLACAAFGNSWPLA